MKLDYVTISGFRGFRGEVTVKFAPDFTIIDGRNGVGKSTIFDAVEFALTGQLSKFRNSKDQEKKSDRESVRDYIWWKGDGKPTGERFVEVGFSDAIQRFLVRRTPYNAEEGLVEELERALVDGSLAPPFPLRSLCASSIIRDEQIAEFSLDLPDVERYRLLRQAIGAADSTVWLTKASGITREARDRAKQVLDDVGLATSDLARASRQLDEIGAAQPTDEVVTDARYRLGLIAGAPWNKDSLPRARSVITRISERVRALEEIADTWPAYERAETESKSAVDAVEAAKLELRLAEQELEVLPPAPAVQAKSLASAAAEMSRIIRAGLELGRQDERCPLCATPLSEHEFAVGTAKMLALATTIDEEATALEEAEAARNRATKRVETAKAVLASAEKRVNEVSNFLNDFRRRCRLEDLEEPALKDIQFQLNSLIEVRTDSQSALSILETSENQQALRAAESAVEEAKARLATVEAKAAHARTVERSAAALEMAVGRAANETLKLRLERVLPLMSELYQRLRPHPHWRDITYSLRGGDIRQFLKLEVGDNLNPQFLFSSGQRRATGLAFLLSINLSLAWSRWQTVLLDDPVQHVDDFRTVHLAEVLAQIVNDGRQVICAVEDPALADLLTRRLPVRDENSASRVTLAMATDGLSKVIRADLQRPLKRNVLADEPKVATG